MSIALSRLLALLSCALALSACVDEAAPPPTSVTAQPPGAAPGRHLVDRVTRVRDGDTVVVGLIPVRIANLDCAERGTISGDRATRRVRQLVEGRTLTCRLEGRRSYDREVGVCALPGGQDLGEVMIAGGYCARWRWR